MIGMLTGMSLTLNDHPGTPTEEFADDLISAAKEVGRIEPEDGNWAPTRSALVRVLDPNGSLACTAKATQVSREYENIFRDARILSDIRPIFPRDSNKPRFAVIVHLLRIAHRNSEGRTARAVFALDRSDLLALKATVDRALEKDESLHAIISAAGLNAAEPGKRQQ
jgi:hypothetical protein